MNSPNCSITIVAHGWASQTAPMVSILCLLPIEESATTIGRYRLLHPGTRGPLKKLGQKHKRGSQIEPYRLCYSWNGSLLMSEMHFRSNKPCRKWFGGPFLVHVSNFIKFLLLKPTATASGCITPWSPVPEGVLNTLGKQPRADMSKYYLQCVQDSTSWKALPLCRDPGLPYRALAAGGTVKLGSYCALAWTSISSLV